MSPEEKFIEACRICDTILLLESIGDGVDVNLQDEIFGSYFGIMIYRWGSCWGYHDESGLRWPENQVIEFANIIVDNGFDMNMIIDDGDVRDFYWYVARWSESTKLLEVLFKRGMNSNHLDGDRSMLDNLYDDIFMERMCDCLKSSKYLYEACRLSIAYGTLPGYLIRKDYHPFDEKIYNAAISLNSDYFIELAETSDISGMRIDYLMVKNGKYGYPKEYYFETDKFQKRLIDALIPIVSILGICNLDIATFNECVYQQYDQVLEYLLDLGKKSDCNYFSPHYGHVISSALDIANTQKEYYEKEVADRMIKMLLDAGER